ncbi:S8 family serine peptidase [Micromonospora sp. NPDC048170]|uniref:S8 family peptidase n=1 Tax=Micromonospora sp. NPDC048170 TaxID=3154819 RepID=UPI0033DC1953
MTPAVVVNPAVAAPPTFAGTQLPLSVPDDVLKLVAGSSATVPLTLITGDVVHVGLSAQGKLVVREVEAAPREGGAGVAFHTITRKGSTYVVPNDALSSVGSGLLDWGLFDVAKLATVAAAGIVGQVPTLITYTGKAAARSAAPKAVAGASMGRALPSVNGQAMIVKSGGQWWREVKAKSDTRSAASARAAGPLAGVGRIWLNERVSIALEDSVPQIGAPAVWARGFDGSNVTVAVLDSGIDATHPDVAGRLVDKVDFTNSSSEAKDLHGHGTHVAATILGTGAASNGLRKGVAPGAKLLVGKVCDETGSCPTDAIIAGMEWAAHSQAKVINMSLGGGATDGTDLLSQTLNNLSRTTGKLFVVSAGNSGPAKGTVGAPGAADEALTVAAVDKEDEMASFSSRGPRVGDGEAKPDIAAPGVAIVAARASGTAMGTVVDDHYTSANGTSMAAPHVAGAAAIVASKYPDLTGPQIKALLMNRATDLGHDVDAQGVGRVDLAAAVDPVIVGAGSLSFGRYEYPHSPVTRTHTYTNFTDQPITLKLSTTMANGEQPAPAGLLTLSSSELTVPAKGSADVTVTINGGVLGEAGPYGSFNGKLTAHDSAGKLQAGARINTFLEPIRHELTVKVIPPTGAVDFTYGSAVFAPMDDKTDLHENPVTVPGDASFSARLYDGVFSVGLYVSWKDSAGRQHAATPMVPEVNLTKATSVTLDLRKAKPVTVQGLPATETFSSASRVERMSAKGDWGFSATLSASYGAYDSTAWALPTGPVKTGTLHHNTYSTLVTPVVTMTAVGGGTPIDLNARYYTPNARVFATAQMWTEGENRNRRFASVPVPRLGTRGMVGVVHAGAGTPEELAGVGARGKLVLLTPTDICTIDGCEFEALRGRVAAAATAGAIGVMVAGPAGMTRLTIPRYSLIECPAGPDSCPAPEALFAVPTVSVPAGEADRLSSRLKGRSNVQIKVGGAAKPEVYTLSFHTAGRIPDHLPYRVKQRDLTRVEHRFHADQPGYVSALKWGPWARSQPDPVALPLPTVETRDTLTTFANRQADTINRFMLEWSDYVGTGESSVRKEIQEAVLGKSNAVRWNTGPTVPGALSVVRTASGFTLDSGLPCVGCRQGDTFLPSILATSSGGARQTIAGIVNTSGTLGRSSLVEQMFGVRECLNCDLSLYDSSGTEYEQTLRKLSIGLGSAGSGPGSATTSGGRR